jgi:DnaJ like chaperone protein
MWGKVVGTFLGFIFGRFFGAVFGLYLGHLFDQRMRPDFEKTGGFGRFFNTTSAADRQAIFFHSTFAVMGHVAKSNGRVNEGHIQAANLIMTHMGLRGEQKKEAQQAFREGKSDDFVFDKTLKDFKRCVFGRREVLQMFLDIQIQAAYSDGILQAAEKVLLHTAAKILGFGRQELEDLLMRWEAEVRFHQQRQQNGDNSQNNGQDGNGKSRAKNASASTVEDAYRVLGVARDSSSQEIKKAYKKMMNENHPDKLVSKGLPPEMMELAKRKTQDIQAAYDVIRQRM